MITFTLKRSAVAAAMVALIVGFAQPAAAQLNSNEATVDLNAELPESLTVSVLPGNVNFMLTSGSATNSGNTPVAVTTQWTLALTRTNVKVFGYFMSDSAALVHTVPLNDTDIPSNRIEVSVNGGALAPFNQTVTFGAPNAGRQLADQDLTSLTIVSQRTDNLSLNINLLGYTLPADVYTGTLRLRAQATP